MIKGTAEVWRNGEFVATGHNHWTSEGVEYMLRHVWGLDAYPASTGLYLVPCQVTGNASSGNTTASNFTNAALNPFRSAWLDASSVVSVSGSVISSQSYASGNAITIDAADIGVYSDNIVRSFVLAFYPTANTGTVATRGFAKVSLDSSFTVAASDRVLINYTLG